MPIFTPDFGSVDAGFPVHDAGRYQVKVTKRKPFCRLKKENDQGVRETSAGVRFNLEIVGRYDDEGELDTDLAGKPASSNSVYLHSEGGWQFSKPFVMACFGYSKNQEGEFNEWFQENQDDFHFSADPGDAEENMELGSAWDDMVDRLVNVTMSKSTRVVDDTTGETEDQQEYSSWAPVS